MMRRERCSSVLAVTRYRYPIFRAMKLNEQGQIRWVWPEHEATRSNDLETTFHDAGQFFWFDVAKFLANERVLRPDTLPLELPGLLLELPGLLPEAFDLLLHELPGVAPGVAGVRGGIRAGQVAGTGEGFWLVTGTRLVTGTPVLHTAGRATL